MMRLLRGAFLWLLAASLLRPSSGDTLDIDVRLFLDSNCFDPCPTHRLAFMRFKRSQVWQVFSLATRTAHWSLAEFVV
eukprot:s3278_g2.t1